MTWFAPNHTQIRLIRKACHIFFGSKDWTRTAFWDFDFSRCIFRWKKSRFCFRMFLLDPFFSGGLPGLLCITGKHLGLKWCENHHVFVMLFSGGTFIAVVDGCQSHSHIFSPPSWPFDLETRPFQLCFFHPYLGKIPMLRVAYFSNGLVQPPTRYRSWAKQTMNSFWRAFEDVSGGWWFSNPAGTD